MNERGIIFLDAVLALAIILLLTLTIAPYIHFLNKEVTYAKQQLHASDVALNAVQYMRIYGGNSGVLEVNGTIYEWAYTQGELCVDYISVKERESYCIQKK